MNPSTQDARLALPRRRPGLYSALLPLAVLAAALAVRQAGTWTALGIAAAAAAAAWAGMRFLASSVDKARAEAHSMEDQLIQSQKLAALGQLASGIAHEVNTPLMIIGQEAELLEAVLGSARKAGGLSPALEEEMGAGLGKINKQVGRCAEITHKLLGFARKSDTVLQESDVNALVEDMILLLERETLRRNITIERDYKTLPQAITDPPLLRQVVLNLINNAAQAVDHDGAVRVATSYGNDHLEIVVSDTGPGLPPGAADKIFNPFFTTKPPGKGTGLGLSMSLHIVNRLGGTITAANAPGSGAVFTVRLPLRAPEQQAAWAA